MTTNAWQPELKFNRYDAFVAVIVALLAIAAALCFYLPKTQSGAVTVVIAVGGQELERIPLSRFPDEAKTITHNGYTLTLSPAVSASGQSGVCISHSDCPTQDCVHTGVITRAGQSIVCLPAQVVIHLEGSPDSGTPDVIVG